MLLGCGISQWMSSFPGIGSIIVIIGYIIGMLYKLYMIHKGTYTEEEPVFLKYK